MTEISTELPPELVAEAMSVMGRAFTAIRSATSQKYAGGERLSPERLAAVGMLADALHNAPDWIRSRWRTDGRTMRCELDVAIGAIEFLHGRGPFVPRGPFRAEFVQRMLPAASAPCRAPVATPGGPRRTGGRMSLAGGLAVAGGLVAVCGLAKRLRV